MSKPFYCDQLEKFINHAVARFTHAPDPQDRTKVEVKRVQFTLDTATHPVPGRHYEFIKDPDTGAESMIEYVPPQKAAAAPEPANVAVAPGTPPALRTDGPTIEEFVFAGYKPENYPPAGYAERPSAGLDRYRAQEKAAAAAAQAASAPSPGEGASAATAGAAGEVIDVGGEAPPVVASAASSDEGAEAAPAEAQTVQ